MDARPKASEIKKYLMWSKINQLKREGQSISQIKKLTGHDRKTIRKYLRMTEEEFRARGCCVRRYHSRLDKYRDFIVERLEHCHSLSSASIHSQLRMSFGDLEKFNQKTVYNYVRRIRKEENIPMDGGGDGRPYCMLEQTPAAEYAQADFGEKWTDDGAGVRKKVYFFVLVLSRWRHKFVWFGDTPFTAGLAVYAHELTFDFFGGVPRNIVYDQDKVPLRDENMGDYILTAHFGRLVAECGFNAVFCRRSDPESKGKVENVVRYVKHNFLAGYVFRGMEALNGDCLRWLETTANGLPHATTGMIPVCMYEQEEKERMIPYRGVPSPPRQELPTYMLRKDNTISYRGNYYAVPLGSYKGRGSSVRVLEKDSMVEIYSSETGKLLMRHPLCTEKGRLVTNGSCRRNPDQRIETLEESITGWLGGDTSVRDYLSAVRRAYPRNIRDNFMAISSNMESIGREALRRAMSLHLEASSPGVNAMLQTARSIGRMDSQPEVSFTYVPLCGPGIDMDALIPERTSMMSYSNLFN
ncbi:MAG: IS21 family transposase [Muribaculaceae bacterium]|nr:IS21 family transposase [Muribaculaceae bacterium]